MRDKIPVQNMPEQKPKERILNFKEVALGYTKKQAILEAKRCIQCKKPSCVCGCPVEIDIPSFVGMIVKEDFEGAINKIKQKNNLPAICGRVCPQETQCEQACVLHKKHEGICIGRLERFVSDWQMRHTEKKSQPKRAVKKIGKRVAVVGSGPAGLTAAGDLARMGYDVTLFEALHASGGVLRYGIPEFRLPKNVVDYEINYILSLGVEFKPNVIIGKTIVVSELFLEKYSAVFLGSGAGLPYFLGIPGENFNGVYSANEFLTRVNLMHGYEFPDYDTPVTVGKAVAVIGGGNTAMDAVRSAKRIGAEKAMIIYRRSEIEMPARREEAIHAKEEGIEFQFLTNPTQIFGDELGNVTSMECLRMELGPPDESGRRRPIPLQKSEFRIPVDTIVIAIGQGPNPVLTSTMPELKLSKWGNIIVDTNGMTSIKGVFAGGDIVTGEGTVIAAMGQAKKSAFALHQYLSSL